MRRIHPIVLLIVIVFIFPWAVSAQTGFTLPTMEVDLWPEYDDPGMLVIYRITLPGTASLPVEFKLRIPAAAGAPNAVAARQPDGSLLNLNYNQVTNGPWSELSITVSSPELQVEYYDPGIVKQETDRTYRYQWLGDHGVGKMSMQVQQPVGAESMNLPAGFSKGVLGSDGLVYYTAEIGSLDPGQPLVVDINYQKSGNDLSISRLQVQPADPISQPRSDMASILPWVLGILGIAFIAGGVLWYWRGSENRIKSRSKGGDSRRHKPAFQKSPASSEGFIYCPQCGKRATSGDRFCRTCGAELRR